MDVPPAFVNLAKTRGTNKEGAVPADTVILFAPGAGPNMIHFIRKLRELNPKMIIGQPTYGFPAIHAEIDVINASWDEKGNNKNLADSIGLMVYEGTNSLNYVKNYNAGTSRWEGFKIKVNAPNSTILLGAKGSTR